MPTVEADVLKIIPQLWPKMIRSQGSSIADEVAVLGARVEGRVEMVHVDLGDVVKAGQTLVSLRQREFQFRVEQAEAALLQARSAVGQTLSLLLTLLAIPVLYSFFDDLSAIALKALGYRPEFQEFPTEPAEKVPVTAGK